MGVSRFDKCAYSEYVGEYSLRLCHHPNRKTNETIELKTCRGCKQFIDSKSALKSCPFCGNKVALSGYFCSWHAKCRRCGAGMSRSDPEKFVQAWNTRNEKEKLIDQIQERKQAK